MFSFFKKKKLPNLVEMPEIQPQPEQPEKKEPVRTDFKNGCFSIAKEDGQTLYSKDGKILVTDTVNRFVFQDAILDEFVSVQYTKDSFWSYNRYNYDNYNADGLRIYTNGTFIMDEKTTGPNLIMFPYSSCYEYAKLSIYSKVLKRFVSPEDGMREFWFDGVIGIFNEDKELTAVKAVRNEVEYNGYGTLMETKKYRTTYIIDLDGNITDFVKEEIKEEETNEEK